MIHDLRALAALLVLLAAFPAARAHAQDPPRHVPRQVIVRLSTSAGDGAALRAELGASIVRRFDGGAQLWMLRSIDVADAVERLQGDARVARVEPNYIIMAQDLVPDDPRFGQQWALQNTGQSSGRMDADVDAPGAWSITTGGPVLVGVLDSGIDFEHPELSANIYTNPNEIDGNLFDDDANGFVDDVHGWDFVNDDNSPIDANGHGTHVAGTIAAAGNNGAGIAGISWSARILPIKILDSEGLGNVADAVRGIEYATRMGVRLTNNSWGGFTQSYALRDAITAAAERGILFVASAGNDGRDNDRFPFYPAAYPMENIITVASSDRNDALSTFSNFGALSVHLAAPGTGIVSTFPDNSYGSLSGTSMSAAFVSGAACLLWGRAPLLTCSEVKDAILSSVDSVPALSVATRTGGRLNVHAMMSTLDAVAPSPVANLAVESVSSGTARLTWTAPGDDGSSGTARSYELRYSLQAINAGNFAAALRAAGVPSPHLAGSFESVEVTGLNFLGTYYFALVAEDEAGNRSILSNVASATTLGVPQLNYSPDFFSANLYSGGIQSRSLSLANTGNGTLDFAAVETPSWGRLDPPSGRIPAGQSFPVNVIFDAAGIATGVHAGALLIATNVPGQAAVSLPLSLQVAGAPDIATTDVLDFGSGFVPCEIDSLPVTNRGAAMLQVSQVTVTEGSFVAVPAPFLVGPGETRPIIVSFCPVAPGRAQATLQIHSNDPDHPVLSVTLLGRSVEPPAITVSPPSLSATIRSGGAATRTLAIENHGVADLHYEIAVIEPGGTSLVDHVAGIEPGGRVVATGRPLTRDEMRRLPVSLPRELAPSPDRIGALDPSPSRGSTPGPGVLQRVNGSRLEEVFGSKENLFTGGLRLRGNFYACTKSTNLREHRFYLDPVASGEIWLLVYEGLTQSGVYELVSASDISPSGDIAGWYSSGSIQTPLQAGRYYLISALFEPASDYYIDAGITPYPVAASFGQLIGGAGTTWNAFIGFPPYQFQFVPPSAFGEAVAYHQTLVTDGVITWASVDRGAGTVSKGQSLQLGVDLRAAPGFPDGAHTAQLRITTNDPVQPEVTVPVQLNVVAAPNLALSGPAIEFGECYTGIAATDTIVVSNTGTQTLLVSGLSTNRPHFAVNASGFSLVPNQNIIIPVTFTPPADGPIDGALTIASNDPDAPAVVVPLRGRRVPPPMMSVTPPSFNEVLTPGSIVSRVVSITNPGQGELFFTIDANVMADPLAAGTMAGRPDGPASTDITPARVARPHAAPPHTYSGIPRAHAATAPAGVRRSAVQGALRVLLLHASDVSEIRDVLLGFPDISVVDEFDAALATPALSTLVNYHSVILISDLPYLDPVALGDVLADYVEQGGGVVVTLASFVQGFDVLGRFVDGGFLPFTPGYGPNGAASLGARDADHALMNDVTAASGDLLGVTILEPDARMVADWNVGLPLVATRGERVVAINVFLGNGGFWTGHIPALVHNALSWVTRTTWLRTTPGQGTVQPNSTLDVVLAVSADRLAPGDYFAMLRLTGNAPVNGYVMVPVTLTVDTTPTTDVPPGRVPERFALLPNHPNPFNPSTTIAYELPHAAEVRIVVYDVGGRHVRELVSELRPAGRYDAAWDGLDDSNRPVASGVYFCRLTAGSFADTKKMVLLK